MGRLYREEGDWGDYVWDVDMAYALARSHGLVPLHIPDEALDEMLEGAGPTELDSDDREAAGIIVRLEDRLILIDGWHRAMLCRQRGQRFYAYLLGRQEAEGCLIESPARGAQARI